jgi:hypothetical protein
MLVMFFKRNDALCLHKGTNNFTHQPMCFFHTVVFPLLAREGYHVNKEWVVEEFLC